MAREARKISKSGNYYVVLKGEELFVTDEDKKMFLEILEKNFATGIVHGYELMQDEIRLVVKEGEKGISMTMKPVTTSYARYFNRTHDREGKLFTGRFKSEPLETDDEIEECIKNLKGEKKTTPKKAAAKPTPKQTKKAVPKKPDAQKTEPKKTAVIEETPKPAAKKKNLPSWLL
ncbi:MAG: hypothetical protein ACI4A5_09800 [Hominilimicola sp.]